MNLNLSSLLLLNFLLRAWSSVNIEDNERIVVKYDFNDRCNNYALLGCDNAAAKGEDQVKPYAGTQSIEGIWYFKDKVTYEKDKDTLKVSIQFGHDALSGQRKRVVMMAVDQSKYLEYDEVTHMGTDGRTTISRTFCRTSAPDTLPEAADEAMKNLPAESQRRHLLATAHAPLRGDSQLDETAQAFHQHVRRNLLGFGHLHINLPLEQHQQLNNVAGAEHQRRALSEDDGVLKFESPMTTQHVEGKLLVKTVEDVLSLSGEFTREEAENILQKFADGTYLTADVSGVSNALIPKSIITEHIEDIVKGQIQWPQDVCVENLGGFESSIPSRFDLDSALGNAETVFDDCEHCFVPYQQSNCVLMSDRATPCTHCTKNLASLHCPNNDGECLGNICQRVEEESGVESDGKRRSLRGVARRLRSRVQREHQRHQGGDYVQQAEVVDQSLETQAGDLESNSREAESRRNLAARCDADLRPWEDKSKEVGIDEPTWTTFGYPRPRTPGCTAMRREVERLYEDFRSLAKGGDSVMAKVDRAAKRVVEGTQDVERLEKDLKYLESSMNTLGHAMGLMRMLPYVGPVIGRLRHALQTTKTNVISPAKKRVTQFNDKLKKYKIADKACKTSKKTVQLAGKMSRTSKPHGEATKSALFVDSVCPNVVPSLSQDCQNVANEHQVVNDKIDAMQKKAREIQSQLQVPGVVLDQVMALMRNGAYKAFVNFLKALSPVLRPIQALMNRRLTVSVPWPVTRWKNVCVDVWYPCGARWCYHNTWFGRAWYTCGVNWCKKRSCTRVHYPAFEARSFSFTVGQIISGGLSLVDIVMAPFNRMIQGLVHGLGINLSALALPGFPGVPHFPAIGGIPDLPDVPDLPQRFPWLPQLPTQCRA